jgi:hypothetical protein
MRRIYLLAFVLFLTPGYGDDVVSSEGDSNDASRDVGSDAASQPWQ